MEKDCYIILYIVISYTSVHIYIIKCFETEKEKNILF